MDIELRWLDDNVTSVWLARGATGADLRSAVESACSASGDIKFVFAQRLVQDTDSLEELGAYKAVGAQITVVHSATRDSSTMKDVVPPSTTESEAETAVITAAVEEASEEDNGRGQEPTEDDGSIQLLARAPSGRIVPVVATSASEPIVAVARRAASHPELHLPAARVNACFGGCKTRAEDTVGSLRLREGDCLQLVQAAVSLLAHPSQEDMVMDCKHCGNASVPTQLRPLCSVCFSEAVRITAGSCTIGAIRWEQLLQVRVECFECGAANKPAAFGFLCQWKDPDSGLLCPSRQVEESDASLAHRSILSPFKCSSRQHLAATLQAVIGGGGGALPLARVSST